MKSLTKPALRVVRAAEVQLSLNVQNVLLDVKDAFYGLCVNAVSPPDEYSPEGGADEILDYFMEVVHVFVRGSTSSGPSLHQAGLAGRGHDPSVGIPDEELAQELASGVRATS